MISLREFEDVFSMLAPWESDAEAFVRTDADGIVDANSMFADTEEINAAYDAMKEGSWIAFPDASELRLGHRMALRFAREFLSEEQCERVVAIFSRRGAFRRFKDFLDECGKLQDWYGYEELTVLEALKQWLRDNDIDYMDDRPLSRRSAEDSGAAR